VAGVADVIEEASVWRLGRHFPARLVRVAALAGVAALGVACGGDPASTGAHPPSTAGDRVKDVDVRQLRQVIAAARGRVVLVNVWATWCDPCREEFPDLVRLKREQEGSPFELILVSADFASQLPQVRQFLAEQRVDFVTYRRVGDDMEFINGLEPRWSGSIPATLLYGRDGALAEFWEGKASYTTFAGKVRRLLDKAQPGR
jgi:thiol-disulfide isomerase/thioredoxin